MPEPSARQLRYASAMKAELDRQETAGPLTLGRLMGVTAGFIIRELDEVEQALAELNTALEVMADSDESRFMHIEDRIERLASRVVYRGRS